MKINRPDTKTRRKTRVRYHIKGTGDRPRLSVFRSNKYIYAQVIDDQSGRTVAGGSEKEMEKNDLSKAKIAYEIGKLLAVKIRTLGLKAIVFDRGSYKYHGRIKALADGVREGGITF